MEQKILPSQGKTVYAEALEMAIEREIKAKYMYKTIARHTQVGHMKAKMEFLADEEQSHRENLEDLYVKIVGESKDFDAMVSFPDESKGEGFAKMEIKEILGVAIGKETEAYEFYKDLAKKEEVDSLIDLFNYLAEEELTHRRMLELELKLYTGEMPLSRPVEAIPGVYREWW